VLLLWGCESFALLAGTELAAAFFPLPFFKGSKAGPDEDAVGRLCLFPSGSNAGAFAGPEVLASAMSAPELDAYFASAGAAGNLAA
jgi:hypothetical protein